MYTNVSMKYEGNTFFFLDITPFSKMNLPHFKHSLKIINQASTSGAMEGLL